jgi:hypothetical protein
MRRPRDLLHDESIIGEIHRLGAWIDVPIATRITDQPREWRRAAAWLRQVADWWDHLADQQERRGRGEG